MYIIKKDTLSKIIEWIGPGIPAPVLYWYGTVPVYKRCVKLTVKAYLR